MTNVPKPTGPNPAAAPTLRFITPPCSVVRLRVGYSGLHPDAREVIEGRLGRQLRGSGIGAWTSEPLLVLCNPERPISHRAWSWVIGWLLCQPEVVFVARLSPSTRRVHGQAK